MKVQALEHIDQMAASMKEMAHEHKLTQTSRIKLDSKIKSLQENIKFLEKRISSLMTEKEDQTI